jgi:hypothetical protein
MRNMPLKQRFAVAGVLVALAALSALVTPSARTRAPYDYYTAAPAGPADDPPIHVVMYR